MKDSSSKELAQKNRRQQMMRGVPKLFYQRNLIFWSLNCTFLPRHELIKTILTSHLELTNKGRDTTLSQCDMEMSLISKVGMIPSTRIAQFPMLIWAYFPMATVFTLMDVCVYLFTLKLHKINLREFYY